MSLLIFHFWTVTVLTFLKIGLELFKEKALKKIPKYGRTQAQSWPQGSGKNNDSRNCIALQLTLTLYFKMLPVASSGLVLIYNIFEETYFCHLHAYLLVCFYEPFLASYIYFHLDDSKLWKQYQFLSQEMMGQICNLETVEGARNSNQGLCNVL